MKKPSDTIYFNTARECRKLWEQIAHKDDDYRKEKLGRVDKLIEDGNKWDEMGSNYIALINMFDMSNQFILQNNLLLKNLHAEANMLAVYMNAELDELDV